MSGRFAWDVELEVGSQTIYGDVTRAFMSGAQERLGLERNKCLGSRNE